MPLVRLLLVGLIASAAVLAETSLADAMEIRQVVPSLIALAALAWQLACPGPYTFLASGAIALVGDLFAPGRVGLGAASMLLVAYAAGRVAQRLRIDHFVLQVPIVLVGTAAWVLSTGLLRWLSGDASISPLVLLRQAPAVAAYTAAVALPVLMVVGWMREAAANKLAS